MLELAAISAGVTILQAAVGSALKPVTLASGLTGNRTDRFVVWGWRHARNAIGCFRKNWTRLDAQENHILYRAMLLAHWRAIQQAAGQYAQRRGIALASMADALR